MPSKAYTTHDGAYTVDVQVNPPAKRKLDDAGVERIFAGLRDLIVRLDRVEQTPELRAFRAATKGPGMAAPRELSLPEAHAQAQATWQSIQAERLQKYSHEHRPGSVPLHPSQGKEIEEERRQQTTDARHARHAIARQRLTFADSRNLLKMKQQNAEVGRNHALMDEMKRQISKGLNK